MANSSLHAFARTGPSFTGGSTTTPAGPVTATEIADAQFLPNSAGVYIDYTTSADGTLTWTPHLLRLTLPSSGYARAVFVTVQKGTVVSGSWTAADDKEGASETDLYLGRMVYIAELDAATRGATIDIPGASMDSSGSYPKNSATYRTFRYRIYVISTQSTSGGDSSTTVVLQTGAFTGADHADLIPDNHPTTLDGTLLKDATVTANAMAQNAITAANGALAANAVVDNNIASVGVTKLVYGTTIFAGDVYLSRGTGFPVISLLNTGIYLYSAALGANGTIGSPYVVIQSVGIGLYVGSSSRSLTLTGSSLTLWYTNGYTGDPYLQLQSTGISIVSGSYSLTATASQILLQYSASIYTALNSAGLRVVSGSYSLTAYSTGITLSYGSIASVAITTAGVTISNSNVTMYLGTSSGYSNSAVFTYNGLSTVITGNQINTGSVYCAELFVNTATIHFPTGVRTSSAGSASGYYLTIVVAGTEYKLALLNAS